MRSRLRLRLHRAAVLPILIGFWTFAFPQLARAQATAALPKSWNDAVAELAEKIAAAASPATPVRLELRNISSLDASYAAAIRAALVNDLRSHSFRVESTDTGDLLQLTLSESADSYVWVAEMARKSQDQASAPTIIVAVPRTDLSSNGAESQSLSLEKRLIWEQPEKFLDFALLNDSTSSNPRLLVLGTNQITLYKFSDAQWRLSSTTPIPRNASPSRDPRGTIHLKERNISVEGFQCAGDPDLAGTVRCDATKTDLPDLSTTLPERSNGVGTSVPGECRGDPAYLHTSEGDWTQTDSIQGYLMKKIPLPMVLSGDPIEFDGPVMSLQPESDTSAARAVVHNLKTGNYEGYIVTATCSH